MDAGFFPQEGGAPPSTGKKGGRAAEQSIRAVTISQIYKVVAPNPHAQELMLDGHQLRTLSIVGKIRKISPSGNATHMELDDGTGVITVADMAHDYIAFDNGQGGPTEGMYIRVYGDLVNTGDGSDSYINAFRIKPVTDWNEITFHYLEVVKDHLDLGRVPKAAPEPAGYGGGYAAAAAAAPQGGRCVAAVTNILQQYEAEAGGENNGLNVGEIVRRLQGTFGEADVRHALQDLTSSGVAYETVDADWYRIIIS